MIIIPTYQNKICITFGDRYAHLLPWTTLLLRQKDPPKVLNSFVTVKSIAMGEIGYPDLPTINMLLGTLQQGNLSPELFRRVGLVECCRMGVN